MSEPEINGSKWVPPLVGRMTKEIIESQAAHARELKRKYIESEQRGFASGLEKAKRQAETLHQTEKKSLLQLLEKLAQPLHELELSVLEELKGMIQTVVTQLTYHAYQNDPSLIFKVVEEGIAALPAQSKEIIVRLHHDDAKRVRNLLQVTENQSFKQLYVIEDSQLKSGDVVFKTQNSELDATLDDRIHKVIACLWSETKHDE